ncbi:SPOR domain-containing protein [Mucilaginibacter calamicampi]|uniref:SPOR domain-containing protein n=1 Tax=Mucilaginibacter calamicampi TaxID=1302352 RepID=A0ABW2YTD4_9SPHI
MKKASVYKAKFSLMIRCFLFICIFIPAFCTAQTRGTVKVFKDARIDSLIAHRNGLKSVKGGGGKFSSQGYRIQIFSGANRKEAYNIQARFQAEYPGIRTYISYKTPDFKLHVGDFRTRLEAEKQVQDMKYRYTGLYITAAKINPPKAEIQ